MNFNLKLILNLLGLLLLINGLFMLSCLGFSFWYGEESWKSILAAGGITITAGIVMRLLTLKNNQKEFRKKDGYLVVTFGWLAMSLTGSLPYLLSGSIPSVSNAFFETMSGYTTTGATILEDIEILPKGILFWRSITHWLGGMGIIVLTIAILPLLGIGGMQLFVAEAPGPAPDKLHPRIKETAKRLWFVYFTLTAAETILLMVGDMSFFDSVNHAMSTMATGGFSPKNASIAHYTSPYIHYVIIIFMFLAGTNFTLTFFGFRGNFKKVLHNEEFRIYAMTLLIAGLITTLAIYKVSGQGFEESLREGYFQVVSIITTTGFITADYTTWAPFITVMFFILFFTGGSTGSTGGGIKMMRHLLLIKNSFLELKRQIHPMAVLPVRFNKMAVSENITYNISSFILIYFLLFLLGSLIMAFTGVDFMTALGSVTATLGNIGPGFGTVGPVDNYAHLPVAGKWILSFFMLLGRLELFTVLILFMPYFWRKS